MFPSRLSAALTLIASAALLGNAVSIPSPAGASSRIQSSSNAAWPMVGHDAQRTHRSPVTGPPHPHLLFTYPGAEESPIVGPDGRIFTWTQGGLLAIDTSGHRLWLHHAFLLDGGPPVLGPDDRLAANGFVTDETSVETSAVLAITRSGRLAWKVQPAAFSKSVPPLVSSHGVFYIPYVGPTEVNSGLAVITRSGRERLVQRGFSFSAIALGRNGSIYSLGRYPSRQGSLSIERLSQTGKVLWSHALGSNGLGLLVGAHGIIYASDGSNVGSDTSSDGSISAYAASGRLLWRLHTADGMSTLAQASDGTVLAAGQLGLSAITPDGSVRWHIPLGRSEKDALPSIVVDSTGTIYVGSGDGVVQIIGRDGELESRINISPPSTANSPALALGPDGKLVVTGTDGVLRVYGT